MTIDVAAASHIDLVDGVLHVVVSDPAAACSLSADGILQGTEALRGLRSGEIPARAVLLVGPGANFCAGGNVRGFHSAADRPAHVAEVAAAGHDFVRALAAVEVPVVVGVRGWAAGAGMSLVLSADVAVGGPGTRMRPAYTGIGLTPDLGMTWLLPRAVGRNRAHDILLTDPVIDAARALELGILSRVVDSDEDVAAEAARIAAGLAAGPRGAFAAIKRLLDASPDATLDAQLDAEAASISERSGTPEGIEGVDAFVEKRRPSF